jgi:hypothetical protein
MVSPADDAFDRRVSAWRVLASGACLGGEIADNRAIAACEALAPASEQGKIFCASRRISGGRRDCTVNARISGPAHEITSMIDRVIERLRHRWFKSRSACGAIKQLRLARLIPGC